MLWKTPEIVMKSHLVHRAGPHERTFVAVFDEGENPTEIGGEFAKREKLGARASEAMTAVETRSDVVPARR